MTVNKKDILAGIAIVAFTIIYTLGLYQSNTIHYGNITLSKPFGYRFHSAQFVSEQSKAKIIINYLGLYTKFKKTDETIMLIYQDLYTFSETGIIINFYKPETLQNYEKLQNYKKGQSCIYSLTPRETDSEKILIQAQLLDENTTFSIIGDNQHIVETFFNSICKDDTL